jgi:hypothetical protein
MGVGVAVRTDDALGAPRPGRGDRVLAREAVAPGDVQGDIGRAEVVALGFVGLERALLGVETDVRVRVEEGGQGEGLEIRARQRSGPVGVGQLRERLRPCVSGERVAARGESIGGGSGRQPLGHRLHCAPRTGGGSFVTRDRRRRTSAKIGGVTCRPIPAR